MQNLLPCTSFGTPKSPSDSKSSDQGIQVLSIMSKDKKNLALCAMHINLIAIN